MKFKHLWQVHMKGEGIWKGFSGEGGDEPYMLFKIGVQGTARE